MNPPLKILLVERRQPDGCLMRALQGDFALDVEWRRVSSETELRLVAREYAATVVLSADDMLGRTPETIVQLLCMLSSQPPQVMICEISDGSAPWIGAAADLARSTEPNSDTLHPAALPAAASTSAMPAPAKPELPHILQSSPDAVVMLDADGWISEINQHARRLLGAGVRSRAQLHVSDLIRSLHVAGEVESTALPLVALNLDGLLALNAVHGTHYGNAVIELIAGVVQPQFARCGFVARLGTNQYLAVFPHLSPPADAAVAVSGGRHLAADSDLTAVFGDTTANDTHINTIPSLHVPQSSIDAILAADEAAQSRTPKQQRGRPPVAASVAPAAEAAAAPATVEADLGDAIARDALNVHFQPQYDLISGRGCGVEALARWTLADGRTLSPGVFIPIAERDGSIGALDAWILEKACSTAAGWRGRDAEGLTLSVNVSNRQICRTFSHTLKAILARSRLPAARLEVEIEEGPLLANDSAAIECLRQWKELGIRIAVHHRNSNYSSLAYLSNVSVDRLKLDKSVIHRMPHDGPTAAMVHATIGLGAALGVDVIAEGVETKVQLNMLQHLKCRHAQGYLLARPMPAVQAQIALRKAWGNLPRGPVAVHRPIAAPPAQRNQSAASAH
jgi:EAL domain-containing protein (putative c-di-GMP-specific phosphodiesterase class I)/PAS domain-containing protein